jgi:hypothetical protein
MAVRCKISCLHAGCVRTAEWDDEAPVYRGLGTSSHTNRTPPDGWILGPDNPVTGQLAEKVRGICPDCHGLRIGFTSHDPPSLWRRHFDIRATAPGVFEVFREDGTHFGQVRWTSRQAVVIPEADAPMDHINIVAGRIGLSFNLQ